LKKKKVLRNFAWSAESWVNYLFILLLPSRHDSFVLL
jgi:hypothetical protein